jgi:hypothetical protein
MKTLIIAGTYRPISRTFERNGLTVTKESVQYSVTIYGQSPERPLMIHLRSFTEEFTGYDELQETCRNIYSILFQWRLFHLLTQ